MNKKLEEWQKIVDEVQYYMDLQKIMADETNVHEVTQRICNTDKGYLDLVFWTSLGFEDKPDRLFVRVGGEEAKGSPLLIEKLVHHAMESYRKKEDK